MPRSFWRWRLADHESGGAILQGIYRNRLLNPIPLEYQEVQHLGALTIVSVQLTLGTLILPSRVSGAAIVILVVGVLGFFRGGSNVSKMLLIG